MPSIITIVNLFLIILNIILMIYGKINYQIFNILLILLILLIFTYDRDIHTMIKIILNVIKDLVIVNIQLIFWLGFVSLCYYFIKISNPNTYMFV
jgi:hypothetical protein